MAMVPELNEISMEYSEHVEEFYTDTFPVHKKTNKHLQWEHYEECRSTYLSGVKSGIGKPEKPMSSFRKAIMLVVIVEKLKGKTGIDKQSFFSDDDLLNHIFVEEDITYKKIETEEAPKTQFLYNKTTVHIIRDYKQKCLELQKSQGNARLVALFLQGENIAQEAKITVDTYYTPKPDIQKRPVTLGIAGRQLYLCCTVEEGMNDPVLCLKEVANIKEKRNDDLLPFIFYKKLSSNRYNSFESAAFPGFYISTSQREHEQVQLMPENDQIFLRDFIMNPHF
ncbi:interleukin-1 beta-like [Bufo bufo]|uniref:interleukin-1 beta-like n=1 Tax=Bufo bufo TaxID=8384 RepID=UPI001ABDB651|nr:interleukin-1 beta-like [Bufo bufo]